MGAALSTLVWWNAGRLVRAGPERQYRVLNGFLEQLVVIITECQGILGCEGDDECIISAVEEQQKALEREVATAAAPTFGSTPRARRARPHAQTQQRRRRRKE